MVYTYNPSIVDVDHLLVGEIKFKTIDNNKKGLFLISDGFGGTSWGTAAALPEFEQLSTTLMTGLASTAFAHTKYFAASKIELSDRITSVGTTLQTSVDNLNINIGMIRNNLCGLENEITNFSTYSAYKDYTNEKYTELSTSISDMQRRYIKTEEVQGFLSITNTALEKITDINKKRGNSMYKSIEAKSLNISLDRKLIIIDVSSNSDIIVNIAVKDEFMDGKIILNIYINSSIQLTFAKAMMQNNISSLEISKSGTYVFSYFTFNSTAFISEAVFYPETLG